MSHRTISLPTTAKARRGIGRVGRMFWIRAAVLGAGLASAGCDGASPGDRSPKATSDPGDPPRATGADRDVERRGRALEALGDWSAAAAVYEDAAIDKAGIDDVWVRKAILAHMMADAPEAAERFARSALARAPGAHRVLFYLGDSQRVTMRFDEAASSLDEFLALEPDHLEANLSLGHVRLRLGDAERALARFDRFLRASSPDGEFAAAARLGRVRALRRLGRREAAADAALEALEIRPFDHDALVEATQSFAQVRMPELAKAARVLQQWLAKRGHGLSSEDPDVLVRAKKTASEALRAADRREFKSALELFRRATQERPADLALAEAAADFLLRLKRFEECLVAAERAVRAAGRESASLTLARATALSGLGRKDEARRLVRDAVARVPSVRGDASEATAGDAATAFLVAAAEFELGTDGDPRVALEWCERAVTSPDRGEALITGARAALALGDVERARGFIAQVGAGVSSDRPGRVRVESVLKGLSGDLDGAARGLMSLVKASPNEFENYRAFKRVFGTQRHVSQVAELIALGDRKRESRARLESAARAAAEVPLFEGDAKTDTLAATRYRELAGAARECGETALALDAHFLASELAPASTASLEAALAILHSPADVFARLHVLRRLRVQRPDEPAFARRAIEEYLALGLRFDAALELATKLAAREPGSSADALIARVRRAIDARQK